ncbi:MAG TPA: type II toxin-antitoxin system HigB family toxin [Hanamia sp.]|nr:type II toxin-antitoxin system HigB family toxin [Hanamia sp.]
MIIISKKAITEYCLKEHQATDSLLNWYSETKSCSWANFSEMKQTFNSVDAVGNDRYVFNIKGNNYRLIAIIHFNVRTVYIAFIGTHKEYEKIDASKVKYKK